MSTAMAALRSLPAAGTVCHCSMCSKAKNGPWAKARPVYNQVHYHVTNVNSDGTIPAQPAINWLTPGLNNFRVNIPLPQERTGDKDQFTYKANDGTLDSNTATVKIDILPPNHAPQILSQPPTVASPEYRVSLRRIGVRCRRGRNSHLLAGAGAGRHDHQPGQRIGALDAHRRPDRPPSRGGQSDRFTGRVCLSGILYRSRRRRDRAERGRPNPGGGADVTLAGAGLTLGTVITTASNTVPAGQVISQGIAAGTSVPAGAAVSLVLSSGPQTATVPNVVGTKPSRGPKRN